MNILVINGSPKGKNSITFQTMLYLREKFPEHNYSVLHVGAQIRRFEMDFTVAKKRLEAADMIVFSYPVYTFLVPAQLHRFIELVKSLVATGDLVLEGKICTQISTSKHFYDITAHRFIEDNARDLGMKVITGLSADMDDLTRAQGRRDAYKFFEHVLWSALDKDEQELPTDTLKDVVVVGDIAPEDDGLMSMVNDFLEISGARLINIHDFKFKGGCLSCFNCSTNGECIYKDGFQELLREKIQGGSAIVLAFSIKDHSMGSLFKMYDDRQFCNGHRTVTMGMPFGYIISGKLSEEENLRTVIEARAMVGGNYLAGVATDEEDAFGSIRNMAKELSWCITHSYTQPANFYGVGGMKIFRDLIWQMQGMMKADYRFFKANGQMDFPQNHIGTMLLMYGVGAVMANDKIKKKMGNRMSEGMLMPYRAALRKAKNEKL